MASWIMLSLTWMSSSMAGSVDDARDLAEPLASSGVMQQVESYKARDFMDVIRLS